MTSLDLTLPSPAANLAADEALLDECEQNGAGEVLRFWESNVHFVVVGYANRLQAEVQTEACAARAIPILRRCTGGGTVLQGPGCLNYSLILKIDPAGATGTITGTNRLVMERNCAALQTLLPSPVRIEGVTDLAVGSLKFSGNAQRRRQHHLLFHGTVLLGFDLALIPNLLRPPSQEPAYRQHRSHLDFVTNISTTPAAVKAALRQVWQATETQRHPPADRIANLVRERYGSPAWHTKY